MAAPAGWSLKASLSGVKEVIRRMERLKQTTRGRIARKAVGLAVRPLAKLAKSKVRRYSGLYAKSMGSAVRTFKKSGNTVGYVGARRGFKQMVKPPAKLLRSVKGKRRKKAPQPRLQDPTNYAHIVERGRKASVIKKKRALSDGTILYGVRVAPAKGYWVIRDTWAAGNSHASATIAKVCGAEITKEAAKR